MYSVSLVCLTMIYTIYTRFLIISTKLWYGPGAIQFYENLEMTFVKAVCFRSLMVTFNLGGKLLNNLNL